jgi:hypothetical protein
LVFDDGNRSNYLCARKKKKALKVHDKSIEPVNKRNFLELFDLITTEDLPTVYKCLKDVALTTK